MGQSLSPPLRVLLDSGSALSFCGLALSSFFFVASAFASGLLGLPSATMAGLAAGKQGGNIHRRFWERGADWALAMGWGDKKAKTIIHHLPSESMCQHFPSLADSASARASALQYEWILTTYETTMSFVFMSVVAVFLIFIAPYALVHVADKREYDFFGRPSCPRHHTQCNARIFE